jgi:hypothetical protein
MARNWRGSVAVVGVVVGCALAWAQPALGACGSWQKVAGVATRGQLSGVSALSSTDVWAVGLDRQQHTLVEHWNGSVWRRVASPDPGRRNDTLSGVVAIAPDDVWAVGSFGLAHAAPLVLHWDGSAWQRMRMPYAARHAFLSNVTAISANDVWAVGVTGDDKTARTLHYNGATWKLVPSISSENLGLSAVAATSSTDVWAVGGVLIEHWDGHSWHRVASPGAGHRRRLTGVAAISPTDALAVDNGRRAIDHWDGSRWTTVATAAGGFRTNLSDVAASGPTDAWVVGDESGLPVVDHWDGATLAAGVMPRPFFAGLGSVTNVPTTTSYWAVGAIEHSGASGNLYATPLIARCG